MLADTFVLSFSCPWRASREDGPTFRPKANKLGGKQQFPYMVDPNTKISMYESDDIIRYLFDSYGEGAKVVYRGHFVVMEGIGVRGTETRSCRL